MFVRMSQRKNQQRSLEALNSKLKEQIGVLMEAGSKGTQISLSASVTPKQANALSSQSFSISSPLAAAAGGSSAPATPSCRTRPCGWQWRRRRVRRWPRHLPLVPPTRGKHGSAWARR